MTPGTVDGGDGDITNWKGGADAWVVKLDKKGSLVWQKTLGGSYNEEGYAVRVTKDGSILVAGVTNSNNGDIVSRIGTSDMFLIKLK